MKWLLLVILLPAWTWALYSDERKEQTYNVVKIMNVDQDIKEKQVKTKVAKGEITETPTISNAATFTAAQLTVLPSAVQTAISDSKTPKPTKTPKP